MSKLHIKFHRFRKKQKKKRKKKKVKYLINDFYVDYMLEMFVSRLY